MTTFATLAEKLPNFDSSWDAEMQRRWLAIFERILDIGDSAGRVLVAPAASPASPVAKVEPKPKTPLASKSPAPNGFKRCARCGNPKGPTAFKDGADICTKCRRTNEPSPDADPLDTPLRPKRFNADRGRAAANTYLRQHPEIEFKGGSEKATWLRNWEAGLVEVTS